MTVPTLQCYIDGRVTQTPGVPIAHLNPYTHEPTFSFIDSLEPEVEDAVQSAHGAFRRNRNVATFERSEWLQRYSAILESNFEQIVTFLIEDIGKPRRVASAEVTRSIAFVRGCAAQILTLADAAPPPDVSPSGRNHLGMVMRMPYGVIGAITPFNAPMNLLIQKVIPAIAAGNAVVVKPHPAGTRVALRLAALFVEAGLPSGLFNVLTGDRITASSLAAHPLVSAVTFTGGTSAGDALARAAGAKKFVAELGSNSANIVLADADLGDAAVRIAGAAFEASGQQCISAQRVIVEDEAFDAFTEHFVEASRKLVVGDPRSKTTDIGPLVSLAAADRVQRMLDETIAQGARYALAPRRSGAVISPAIVIDTPLESPLWRDEVFGPAVTLHRAKDASNALDLANDSPFGLQGSVFTANLNRALQIAQSFEVGSLWINEPSRFRLDTVPFGGMKRSGYGREGIRFAIEELSQLKFVGIRLSQEMA